jgi:ribosome-binding factor A
MSTRRTAKVAQAIREVVSTAILVELRDPRVRHVTVLGVEVPPDLRTARVAVSILGDETTQYLALQGLNSARGFLQARLAEELELRYTPVLTFTLDQGVKQSIETARLLRELAVQRGESPEALSDAVDDDNLLESDPTTDPAFEPDDAAGPAAHHQSPG